MDKKEVLCDCDVIHEDILLLVESKMPLSDDLYKLAEFFKAFSDPTRVKIMSALKIHEMCVCDLAVLLGMTKSAVSHQLRFLRQTRLVKYNKVGKVVFYSLADDHIQSILQVGMAHILE